MNSKILIFTGRISSIYLQIFCLGRKVLVSSLIAKMGLHQVYGTVFKQTNTEINIFILYLHTFNLETAGYGRIT